jgi:hypothetical protein
MQALWGLLAVLAAVLLRALGPRALQSLPWREMAVPAVLAGVLALAGTHMPVTQPLGVLAVAGLFTAAVMAAGWTASPALRAALKR